MKTCRFAFVDVAKNTCEVGQELGGGELSLSTCPEVGNRPPKKKKKRQIPGGLPGGGGRGMVTTKIEQCIKSL